jgi:hypothetical protein
MRDDATLQALLADAAGYRGRTELAQLRRDAERAVTALDARRRAQRDSILAQPGLRLVVDPSRLPGARMNWCLFDPQNVLQTASGDLLHMRVLRVCASGGVDVQLDQPVVENRKTGVLQAVLGDEGALRVTASGSTTPLPADGATIDLTDLRIEGPTLRLVAPRATLVRRGPELRVVPTPGP